MTPKSLLRHPLAASPLADLATGTFQPVLDDPLRVDNRHEVRRLVFCSGKVAVELEASELRGASPQVAVARVEQLAPFQRPALQATIDRYPNLDEVVWVQEEPYNMGAWGYMEPRLRELLAQSGRPLPLRYVGRPERASPAEGFADRHAAEQIRIVAEALAGVGEPVTAGANGHAANGVKGTTAPANADATAVPAAQLSS